MNPKKLTDSPSWGKYLPSKIGEIWIKLCRALPPCGPFRRLGLWLRRPLKYGSGSLIDTELWGLKLRLSRRGNLSEERWMFLPQFSDLMERRMLVQHLKAGGVFFDIGANAGFYSFWVWSHFKDSVRIEAFEPDPKLCESIRFNITTNQINSLHLNSFALSDRSGTAHLLIGAKNRGTNRLETECKEGISVEMTTLANFVAQAGVGQIDAMKIDVEGHEETILGHFFANAPRTLFPRLLICETLDKGHGDDRLRDAIEAAGYRAVARGRMNTVFQLDA